MLSSHNALRSLLISLFFIVSGCNGGETIVQLPPVPPVSVDYTIAQNRHLSDFFTISYQDELPGPLNKESIALGAKVASRVLVLDSIGNVNLKRAVNVTVAFNKDVVPIGSVPIVVSWDEQLKEYSPISISDINWGNSTLTFSTSHAAKYVVLILSKINGS